MNPFSNFNIVLVVMASLFGPILLGKDVRTLSIISKSNYVDEEADVYLAASSISPVTGNVFQAVLAKSDDDSAPYRYYIWELTIEGKRVNEWMIHEGTSKTVPLPSYLIPCLHVLPSGEFIAVIVDEPDIATIAKFDAGGRKVFSNPLTEHKRTHPVFARIVPAGGGKVFVLGGLRGRPAIWKVDEQGRVLFEKEIQIGGDGLCSDGVELPDNRLRICGISQDGENFGSWVIDVDAEGGVQNELSFDGAAWTSRPKNHRIVAFDSDRTAFVHPVTIEGKNYCHLTMLDNSLKKIGAIRLCEVSDLAGSFEIQRYANHLVIAVLNDLRAVSLYVVDEALSVTAVGNTQDMLGGTMAYSLTIKEGRALVLAQRGSQLKKKSHTIAYTVFGLGNAQGQAPP